VCIQPAIQIQFSDPGVNTLFSCNYFSRAIRTVSLYGAFMYDAQTESDDITLAKYHRQLAWISFTLGMSEGGHHLFYTSSTPVIVSGGHVH
jgi:hypothetical protein